MDPVLKLVLLAIGCKGDHWFWRLTNQEWLHLQWRVRYNLVLPRGYFMILFVSIRKRKFNDYSNTGYLKNEPKNLNNF